MPEETRSEDLKILRAMVSGAYDLQMLRMQSGIRLVANFRAKLNLQPEGSSNPNTDSEPRGNSNATNVSAPKKRRKPTSVSEPDGSSNPPHGSDEPDDDSEDKREAKKLLEELKKSYKNLMAGVARNRTLPSEKGFQGDVLISSHPELTLVDNYMALERQEAAQFRRLELQLERFPIWTHYLRSGSPCFWAGGEAKQIGIGPAMGGILTGWIDPHKARHVSSVWKFCGLDVAADGRGRSWRQEHLVEKEYRDKRGQLKTRMSVTYDPWVKTKLMGVLAGSFIRLDAPWRQVYDGYKHRLVTDPGRVKVELAEWKRRHDRGEDVSMLWPPGRVEKAAKRYMIKQFLMELWVMWRQLEGLPVTDPYAVAVLGQRPHRAA